MTASARFPVGLEQGPDGAVHVHSLTIPGCVATGPTSEAALDAFGAALSDWLQFLAAEGEPVPPRDLELVMEVDEWIASGANVAAGESTVCFVADRTALDDAELQGGIRLLGALRGRLIPRIRRARNEDLERIGPPEWNVRMILDELARGQWWMLTRLGSSPLAEVPDRVVARLDTAMALAVQFLGNLPADGRDTLVVLEGEEWTPRKVLRRLLWLEWTLGAAALHALKGAE